MAINVKDYYPVIDKDAQIKALEEKLLLANEIIDELIEVASVHLDDTFEKINKVRRWI